MTAGPSRTLTTIAIHEAQGVRRVVVFVTGGTFRG